MNRLPSLLNRQALAAFWREQRWPPYILQRLQRHVIRQVQPLESCDDLSPEMLERLQMHFVLTPLTQLETSHAADQTLKVLHKTHDQRQIEAVLMRYGTLAKPRYSVCVSSQVGCPARCRFCATGTMSLSRNLQADEILAQVYAFNHQLAPQGRVRNVVFMGMGEPLLNYEAVKESITCLLEQRWFGLGPRQITLSTVGILPGLERMLADQLPVRLAVSLHAPSDDLRSQIVPINKAYPLADLLKLLDRYTATTGKEIMYEYVMLKGLNDGPEQARQLGELFQVRPGSYLNLIPYNPGAQIEGLQAPAQADLFEFANQIRRYGVKVLIRRTLGQEIEAACGQLVTARGL